MVSPRVCIHPENWLTRSFRLKGVFILCMAAGLGACPAWAAVRSAQPTSGDQVRAAGSKTTQPPQAQPEKPQPKSIQPKNLENSSARPAAIRLQAGTLAVGADNSDLARILQAVAHLTGMKIEGLSHSSRVYGEYGPGNPRVVLARLLEGSGYNFMMIGGAADGVPRRLVLTEKGSMPAENASTQPRAPHPPAQPMRTPPQPASTDAGSNNSSSSSANAGSKAGGNGQAAPPPDLGPGAIYPQPPVNHADRQQRVQQMMQRLRQMHQPQTQNNQNQ